MKAGRTVWTMLVVGLCVAIGASGCRKAKPKTDPLGGGLAPEIVGTDPLDKPLSERIEDGERITDVTFDAVLFDYDSFKIRDAEMTKVQQVGDYLRANARVRLIVEGHCDERGTVEYNLALGEHRGLAVRAYLIGLGIDGARIQTRSFGEDRPRDPGHNEAAWRLNRRADFALFR